ncbi:MAG: patatin-like phospholipase family protein, partial [Burkholderiales bacterium]|nr:patatin-like phospholipase family protein [Burkholderiales bacterium]
AAQQLALSTYKDEELPPDSRFADALAILDGIGLRDPGCDSPETLGQGGAIYKRKWERGGQVEDLQAALYFYRKGWQSNPRRDMGYCGVNAVFVLDLLAHQARIAAARTKTIAHEADALDEQARSMRTEMLNALPGFAAGDANTSGQYWYLVTMAEITFGLGQWEAAEDWLAKARQAEHDEWERQTTAKQLVAVAGMRGILPPEEGKAPADWDHPWRALRALLGEDAAAAFDSYRGKVGLALSGGGFRASLYHLGVLARLAECDALRSVEVLSTVSGGSIVGAHYYLALRHLLQTKSDGELGRDAYVSAVREVIDQFCDGVGENLRVRALSNLWANVKMLLTRTYTRSNRMGELYEKYLYAAVPDGQAPGTLRKLRELLIHPLLSRGSGGGADERDEQFKPRFSNWRRKAKVPILLLNTTSLNSGHNWHFTASWMGEPPGLTGQEVDMNERYRRLYYSQAPTEDLRDYPLGYAVAASAGVPALFDPLVLDGLYPDRTVRLVDGGVHDNQGVAGLLDEGCNLILCSDASGQMDDQKSPASGVLSVFLRSVSILQDRLREVEYQDLSAREQSHALQGFFFVHMRQELQIAPIDWVGCEDPVPPHGGAAVTSYGVHPKIQKCLAEVRTDLDSFTEVEAYALMASGYLMTEHQLRELDKAHKSAGLAGGWAGFDVGAPRRSDWQFAGLLSVMAGDPDGGDQRARDLALQLGVSKMLFGKVWKLVPALGTAAIVLALAVLVAVGVWTYDHWQSKFALQYELSVGEIVIGVVVLLVGMLLPLGKFIKPLETFRKWLFMIVLATAGCISMNLHLWLFEPLFKWRGSLARLMKLPEK